MLRTKKVVHISVNLFCSFRSDNNPEMESEGCVTKVNQIRLFQNNFRENVCSFDESIELRLTMREEEL